MKALVLTQQGLEDVSEGEVQALIKPKSIVRGVGRLVVSVNSLSDLAKLCYEGRTFLRVIAVLSEFACEKSMPVPILDGIEPFLTTSATVVCDRRGEHEFNSFEAQQVWSAKLSEKTKIDHKHPATVFYLYIDGKAGMFGVDMSGFDLGKREYRVFLGVDALRGNVAAGLLMIARFSGAKILLDPFCRHGVIPIEAALMATNTSVLRFSKEKLAFTRFETKYDFKDEQKESQATIIAMDDNFKHVSASKKNAKIAGIVKAIEFSRTDLEWLDVKFGKKFLDLIVTLPPQPTRLLMGKKLEKVYHEFFYQAEFILKNEGTVCVCMKRGMDVFKAKAKEFKFSCTHERIIWQGEEALTVLVFNRSA